MLRTTWGASKTEKKPKWGKKGKTLIPDEFTLKPCGFPGRDVFASSVILMCKHRMWDGVGQVPAEGLFLKALEGRGGTEKIARREDGENQMNVHKWAYHRILEARLSGKTGVLMGKWFELGGALSQYWGWLCLELRLPS